MCGEEKMKNGIYVFEGIDHVGKTTIVQRIKEIIDKTGKECIILSFPGKADGTLGALVYDIHHNQKKYFSKDINDAMSFS